MKGFDPPSPPACGGVGGWGLRAVSPLSTVEPSTSPPSLAGGQGVAYGRSTNLTDVNQAN